MPLNDLLAEKRTIILQRWFERVLEGYPSDTQRLFRENGSPYSNPIGFTLRKGMEGVIEEILKPTSMESAQAILEPVMRIRAVENLPPSLRGNFILPLRDIVSEIVREERRREPLGQEWLDVSSRIHQLALLGIRLYSECREKVNQLRVREGKRRGGEGLDRRGGV